MSLTNNSNYIKLLLKKTKQKLIKMKNKAKIALSLVLIMGFIAITSSQLISPVTSDPPAESGGDDRGNSPGPGLNPEPEVDPKPPGTNSILIQESVWFSQN